LGEEEFGVSRDGGETFEGKHGMRENIPNEKPQETPSSDS